MSERGRMSQVDKPEHYDGDACMKAIEDLGLGFCVGNALKYIWRCKRKGDYRENLEKAVWYLNRELNNQARFCIRPEADFEPVKDDTPSNQCSSSRKWVITTFHVRDAANYLMGEGCVVKMVDGEWEIFFPDYGTINTTDAGLVSLAILNGIPTHG